MARMDYLANVSVNVALVRLCQDCGDLFRHRQARSRIQSEEVWPQTEGRSLSPRDSCQFLCLSQGLAGDVPVLTNIQSPGDNSVEPVVVGVA